jgi:Flp pilus assembly protein CpaB
LARRRSLPGSRAVVGGLLVAAAAVGLFSVASKAGSHPGHAYVVAARSLAAGTRLQAQDVATEDMALSPAARARAFDDPGVLVGATVLTSLEPGELVQASAVVAKAGEAGSREMSFTVERGHLSPAINAGETIDVVATYGTGNDAYTVGVAGGVLVVGLERGRGGLGETGPVLVTVAVADGNQAIALAHAAQAGKLTVIRTTGVPGDGGPPPAFRQPPPAQ